MLANPDIVETIVVAIRFCTLVLLSWRIFVALCFSNMWNQFRI